ncbi:MAG: hypothetical protein ACRENS_06315 [Candidatus Eiseniibacteriota bacterium]
MIRTSKMFALWLAIAIATPVLTVGKAYADSGAWNSWQHGSGARVIHSSVSTSAQVVVHDDDVAPVLAVLVGGLVLASAIHASQHCDQVVVAAPACPPRYRSCDDRGRGWTSDHWNRRSGHGHGRGHDRGWERHDD